jgi:hypothetical protein
MKGVYKMVLLIALLIALAIIALPLILGVVAVLKFGEVILVLILAVIVSKILFKGKK